MDQLQDLIRAVFKRTKLTVRQDQPTLMSRMPCALSKLGHTRVSDMPVLVLPKTSVTLVETISGV